MQPKKQPTEFILRGKLPPNFLDRLDVVGIVREALRRWETDHPPRTPGGHHEAQ